MKRRRIEGFAVWPMPKVEVSLYHSGKKLLRDLRSWGLNEKLIDGAPGQTLVRHIDGEYVSFVLIDMKLAKDAKLSNQLALLAHEASHIVNWYFDCAILEDHPAEEERAYVLQFIAESLFDLHIRYLMKKGMVSIP